LEVVLVNEFREFLGAFAAVDPVTSLSLASNQLFDHSLIDRIPAGIPENSGGEAREDRVIDSRGGHHLVEEVKTFEVRTSGSRGTVVFEVHAFESGAIEVILSHLPEIGCNQLFTLNPGGRIEISNQLVAGVSEAVDIDEGGIHVGGESENVHDLVDQYFDGGFVVQVVHFQVGQVEVDLADHGATGSGILETVSGPGHIAVVGLIQYCGENQEICFHSGGDVLGVNGGLVAGGQVGRGFEQGG